MGERPRPEHMIQSIEHDTDKIDSDEQDKQLAHAEQADLAAELRIEASGSREWDEQDRQLAHAEQAELNADILTRQAELLEEIKSDVDTIAADDLIEVPTDNEEIRGNVTAEDPDSMRSTNLYEQLQDEYVSTLGEHARTEEAKQQLLARLSLDIGDAEDENKPEIAAIYRQFQLDLDSGLRDADALTSIDAASKVIGGPLRSISAFAREKVASGNMRHTDALNTVGSIDANYVLDLQETADRLQTMNWFGRTFGARGREAKMAQKELDTLMVQVDAVKRMQVTKPEVADMVFEEVPETATESTLPVAEVAEIRPEKPGTILELAKTWPTEINSILTAIATDSASTELAFNALEDTEGYMDWVSSLKGKEITNVQKSYGKPMKEPLQILGVRKDTTGRPTIFMKRKDGGRVTMGFEKFLKKNMRPAESARQEPPALAA